MANTDSIIGDWTLYQHWGSGPTYSFPATFNPDGTVTVTAGGGFSGTWEQSGGRVTFKLAPNTGEGSATYHGFLVGLAMGGYVIASSWQTGGWSGCQTPANLETETLDLMGVGAA